MGLQVCVDVWGAALQNVHRSMPMSVAMTQQRGGFLTSVARTGEHNPLQDQDSEEATCQDELSHWETTL